MNQRTCASGRRGETGSVDHRMERAGHTHENRMSFEATCLPHRLLLYRFAYRLTNNRADAEDLVQDTLVAAYRHFGSFQPDGNATAWLYTILRNRYLTRCNKCRRQGIQASLSQIEDNVLRDRGVTPEQAAMCRAEAGAALDAVCGLPPQYRDVLLALVDAEDGPSYGEVARRSGVPIGTVRSRIHRGRAQVLRRMSAWHPPSPTEISG